MRPVRIFMGLALWLAFGLLALAQQPPGKDVRWIEVEEAIVYSAPGTGTLPTGVLRRGAVVHVLQQRDDGWLEIAPPEGSFSWVNDRFVQRFGGGLKVVSRTPVPLRVGSVVVPDRPTNAQGGVVQSGTQLVPLKAEPVQAEGGRWWPVLPNPSEKRYLLQAALHAPAVAAKEPPPKASEPRPPTPEVASPLNNDERTRALWRQAQEAERAGNLAEAVRTYDEVARLTNEDALRLLALNRAQFLRDGQRGAPRPPPVRPEPVRPPPAAAPPVPPRGIPGKQGAPSYPVGSGPPTGIGAAQPAAGGVTTSIGRLEKTAFHVDGRRAYALVSSEGLPRMYVTAEEGVRLEDLVNRNVEVTGPTVYRGELRTNYMRVTRAAPLQ